MKQDHSILLIAGIISLLLLAFFLILQKSGASILALDAKWILLSLSPLFLALIIGGYVKSFRGFGIELEARLRNSVSTFELKARDALFDLKGNEKQTVSYLNSLPDPEKQRVMRLIFFLGQPNKYYAPRAIRQYVETLTNLQYFEVRRESGEFVCLIPVSFFKNQRNNFDELLKEFVSSLETQSVLQRYQGIAITLTVLENRDILAVLRELRRSQKNQAVVISQASVFLGVVTLTDIEHRIINDVLEISPTKGVA
jgi:hypothetical protein